MLEITPLIILQNLQIIFATCIHITAVATINPLTPGEQEHFNFKPGGHPLAFIIFFSECKACRPWSAATAGSDLGQHCSSKYLLRSPGHFRVGGIEKGRRNRLPETLIGLNWAAFRDNIAVLIKLLWKDWDKERKGRKQPSHCRYCRYNSSWPGRTSTCWHQKDTFETYYKEFRLALVT